jgi:hypothetical protein
MTRNDDFIGQLEAYLEEYEGSTSLPEHVRGAIRAELPSTHQRPAWWPTRRFPEMNSMMKLSLAAAAVVVAALLGYNYVVAPNIGGPQLGDPVPTPEPTPTPVPSALNDQNPLPAGRYMADPGGLPMEVTVEVPDGWSANGAWVVRGPKGNQGPDGMAVRFYLSNELKLYADPLVPGDGFVDSAPGPSADELVAAILSHPGWTVTGTEPITLDGHTGQVVHVTLPEGTTDATPFYLFGDAAGGQVYGWEAGQLFDVYVLDVAGDRLVVDAFHYPGTSAEDLAAQQAVVDSIQIDP